MTYYQLAVFFNQTTIQIQNHFLCVSVRPFPFIAKLEFPLSDIASVVVDERQTKRKGLFHLKIVLKSGKKKILLSVHDQEEARMLEGELKDLLGKSGI